MGVGRRPRRLVGGGPDRWASTAVRVNGTMDGIFAPLAVDKVVFESPFNVVVVAFVELIGSCGW